MLSDDVYNMYKIYQQGKSIAQLSRDFKIGADTISRNFKALGLPILKRNSHLSQDIINKIIDLYNQGLTFKEIEKMGISSSGTICRIMKNHNIKAKKHIFYNKKMQNYHINDNYFNSIDCPEKAYILGFLYADGNAHSKYSHITLKLQEKDKVILEKISKLLETNKPLLFSKKTKTSHQNQYVLKLTNKTIYDDLIKHGVVPRKTFILKFPTWLDSHLVPHFMRGYFDGDGCMYVSKKSGIDWNIIGSTDFINYVSILLKNELNIKFSIRHDHRCKAGIDVLRVRNKKDILNIQNWLYNNSTIHLERKFLKFEEVKKLRKEQT